MCLIVVFGSNATAFDTPEGHAIAVTWKYVW